MRVGGERAWKRRSRATDNPGSGKRAAGVHPAGTRDPQPLTSGAATWLGNGQGRPEEKVQVARSPLRSVEGVAWSSGIPPPRPPTSPTPRQPHREDSSAPPPGPPSGPAPGRLHPLRAAERWVPTDSVAVGGPRTSGSAPVRVAPGENARRRSREAWLNSVWVLCESSFKTVFFHCSSLGHLKNRKKKSNRNC